MRDLSLLVVVVLMVTLVYKSTVQGQTQLTFSAGFATSRYDGTEGADVLVRLSASVLTSIPINFGGSIEVDVTAEDLPGGATFGTDYLVNLTNPLSRIFTVSFLPLQANSTENIIQLSDDNIFEGTESFGLRIAQARFSGQAATIFRADDTLTNAFAEVNIADDDFVEVNFTTSLPREVREGDGVNVTLSGEAFGLYANQIEIGVLCAPVDVTGVPAAFPNQDFSFTPGTRIRFTDVETPQSFSSNVLVVPIINDDIAEPCESLICTLQGGALDAVRGIEPNRVTIKICDDDQLVVRWANDFHEFGESDPATVQLVTDSVFESATVRIQGFPRHIPLTLNGTRYPNRLPTLSVCGPRTPGINFNASIEQAEFEQFGGVAFGNAQVTESGRTDVVNTFSDFIFTPTNKSALEIFTIVDDDVLEFDELLIAEFDFGSEILSGGWNAIKGEPSTAVILIRDDDSVEVNFNEDSYTVAESSGQVSVSLRINGQYFVPVWAIVEIIDGTATDPEDYSSAVHYNVTFCQTAVTDTQTPARSTVSSPILIGIADDDIFEGVEYFQARIVETSDRFRVRIGRDTVNVTIIDSVTVRYEQQNYTVQEEDGYVTLALVSGGEASIPVTVTVRTLDLLNSSYGDAATASIDYTPWGAFEITFPAGSTRQEYTVDIIDDFIPENSEFFNADIVSAGPEGVIIGEPRQPLIEILDTVDEVVTVQYEQERYSVEEEAGPVTLALVLDRAVPFNVTVFVNTLDLLDSSVGDAATANVDYTPKEPFEITFPAGSTRQEYTMDIIDDLLPENSEFFNADVNLARSEDAFFVVIGSPKQPMIEIQDLRDAVVAISLDRAAYSIVENEQVVTVTLTLNDTYQEDIIDNVAIGELLGIPDAFRALGAGVDFFTAGFPGQVTIPAGQTSIQFNISVRDDLIVERDELFQVSFTYSGSQPGVVVNPDFDEANITIRNDDALRVMFESDSYSVREDEGSLMYRVIATVTASFDYEVVITGADGSATCGSDYHEPIDDNSGTDPPVMSCSYSLTIPIPAGSSAGNGVVAIINDTIYKGPEDFFLDLSVAQTFQNDGINDGSPLRATVQIEDDDELRVFFDPADYSVPEGENQVLVLKTDNEFAVPFTIDVTLRDGTAVAPGDYEDRSYQVVFNVTTQMGTLVVFTETDNIIENDEDFTAMLSVPAGLPRVFEGISSEANVTILDRTTAEVYFDPATYSVTEGQPADLILRLTRDVDPSVTIIMMVQTMDGLATDGADYTGDLDTATFRGSSTTSVRVPTLPDDVLEGLEYFTGVIQVPPETTTNYRVTAGSPDTATVNIIDAIIAGVYFDPDVYMVNEGGNVTLILKTNVTVNKRFSVLVNTHDASANSPADYRGGERRVIFEIGSSMATVVYSTVNDGTREGNESFIAELTVPPEMQAMGIIHGMPDRTTVNVIDDEDDLSHDKTALCPTAKDSVWGIQWLAIAAGSIQLAHCPGEGSSSVDGLAYRRCLAGVPAEWGSVDASECESVAGRAVREKTDEFVSSLKKSNGTNRDLTDKERKVFQNISQGLNAVLDPSDERNRSIVPQDLKTAVKFVEVVANLGENNGLFREESNETEKTVADILSNVLDERNAPAFEATAQTDSTDPEQDKAETPAVSILQSTERVANVIATTLSQTKPSFTIARPNLAISGQRFSFNNLNTGIVFPGAGIRDTLASFRNRESLPQIHLPQSFLRAAKGIEASLEDDNIEVVNVVMNNMENYLPSDVIKQDKDVADEPEETFPASRVISSQILGYDGGEVDTKERVEVTFPVNVKSQSLPVPPGKVKQFRCAFFNFEAEEGNRTGRWSYSGVETHVINTSHVRCIASHLTSFAVLVSIIPSVGEPPALDYITYIGCSISLLCLLASIIFYLTLRKELIKKLHNFVHLNLCIALSLGLLFFLTGIQTATANIYACNFMTALLHYFFLATFTWTLCEAVLVYILLVKVFGANERKWIYLYLALGWVLPIPVVVITGGARHDYYLIRASFDQSHPHYNSIKACWLPTENGVIFAFIGPMVAIILVNAVLLTISLVSLARSQCGRVSSKNDEKRQKYMEVGKQLLKTTIILVPLLGFTWIIGLFAVGEEGKAFAYLFVIANVFQGLFIFVLHVLRHEKVYGKIKGKLPSISKLVTAYTGSTSSSAKSTHASTSDTRKVSFVLESEAIIESGVKQDEDAESIKDGRDQDIKLDVITENVEDGEGNECEESHAVATTAVEMSAVTTGDLEETEEKAKGDSTEDHAGQTCAEFTSKERSDNEAGGVMDTVC